MKNAIMSLAKNVPSLIEHTTLDLHLSGWPAATAVFFLCSAAVAITALVIQGSPEDTQNS